MRLGEYGNDKIKSETKRNMRLRISEIAAKARDRDPLPFCP